MTLNIYSPFFSLIKSSQHHAPPSITSANCIKRIDSPEFEEVKELHDKCLPSSTPMRIRRPLVWKKVYLFEPDVSFPLSSCFAVTELKTVQEAINSFD